MFSVGDLVRHRESGELMTVADYRELAGLQCDVPDGAGINLVLCTWRKQYEDAGTSVEFCNFFPAESLELLGYPCRAMEGVAS